ncbi:M24 family metallopeptidase [Dethiosulfatarculus sandiegensis]|uniref:Peptidase M24 n=1 Tax=Dethiosulfatarculus sandiegensis TaxID=1429043 RepID=A0A0D2K3B2_9BACT|nr:Xaa-Pro peptidase family protein [Dethiosulfatarculus sandiegensis]KIX16030.1 hypothetical protein X474_00330 [Dethiosulfatarculus sandiegensis]
MAGLSPARKESDSWNWSFPADYRLVPSEYLLPRLANARLLCEQMGLDGLLFTGCVDVYYLTGTMQQGVLFTDVSGAPHLYLRRHAGRGAQESPFEVTAVRGLTQVAKDMAGHLPAKPRLGACLDILPVNDYLAWQKRLPGLELVDISPAWADIKGVKDDFELSAMAETGQLAVEVYEKAPEFLKPGVSEVWAAGQIIALAMSKGHINILRTRGQYMDNYTWHLVSGPEGSMPSTVDAAASGYGLSPAFPQGASLKILRKNEPIVVDIGFCLHGYQTDQTRTYCLGKASAMVKKAHDCLVEVEEAITAALVPGAVSGEIFDAAQKVAKAHHMEDVFLGQPGHRIRFVGHGLGLELGAPPYLLQGSKEVVRANQAYALELKITLDEGPVGLENTFVVTESGPPRLLSPIPNRLFELDV